MLTIAEGIAACNGESNSLLCTTIYQVTLNKYIIPSRDNYTGFLLSGSYFTHTYNRIFVILTAPLSLAHHCFHELKNNKPEIRCPALKCTFVWPFSLIREAACLSVEETVAFEQKLLINRQSRQVKQCPNCFVSCHREQDENKRVICLNCNFEFCWGCLHEWKGRGDDICGNPDCYYYESKLFKILAKCTTKELLGVKCPSSRACPNCFLIIEHIKDCKHMTCKSCRYEFCFMCLKTHNWLSQSYELCEVAPRQGSGLCEVSPRQGSGISDSSESSCVII